MSGQTVKVEAFFDDPDKLFIPIPRAVVEKLGLADGDELEYRVVPDGFVFWKAGGES